MHFLYPLIGLVLAFQMSFAEELTLQIGETPPELNFHYLQEKKSAESITWDHFRDQVVVIDFWATWCQPCKETIPHLNHLVKEFQDKPVIFLSVTYEPEEIVVPFLKDVAIISKVAIDNDFAMFKSYKAWGIPMAIVVTPERKVAAVIHPMELTGPVIEELLKGNVPELSPHPGWSDPEGAEEYFRSTVNQSKQE